MLPGVTRDSLLALAHDLGYAAEEGKISTDEWQAGNASGALTEVFACGTAAVITPVGTVKSASDEWTVGDGSPGPITMQLRQKLLALQTGREPDRTAGCTAWSDPPSAGGRSLAGGPAAEVDVGPAGRRPALALVPRSCRAEP